MTRTIAIANRKGGVGKTTTTISLGAVLAARGERVLLVDLDAQQSLCTALRVPKQRRGLADVFFSAVLFQTSELEEVLEEIRGMTVVGGYDLAYAENCLSHYENSELALQLALAPVRHRFDFVLIDCAPSIGYLTVSALAAADEVLVPIQTEFLALSQLPAIMSTVQDVRTRLNPMLQVTGFIPTMYDSRTSHGLDVLEQIAAQASRYRVRAFKPIPRTVRLAEAAASSHPISAYAPRSPAALAYEALAEAIQRWERPERDRKDREPVSPHVTAVVRLRDFGPAACA